MLHDIQMNCMYRTYNDNNIYLYIIRIRIHIHKYIHISDVIVFYPVISMLFLQQPTACLSVQQCCCFVEILVLMIGISLLPMVFDVDIWYYLDYTLIGAILKSKQLYIYKHDIYRTFYLNMRRYLKISLILVVFICTKRISTTNYEHRGPYNQ